MHVILTEQLCEDVSATDYIPNKTENILLCLLSATVCSLTKHPDLGKGVHGLPQAICDL